MIHFQYPLWLLALLPLALLLWLLYQYKSGGESQAWNKVIDPNLLPMLLSGKDNKTSRSAFILLGIGWFIATIALADPVWQKIPRPVFQTNAARVIVLDLSRSMLVPDLKPSRLARARFKIEDILSRKEEGQIGLVVFAGDAFTASPLTRDADTIRSLLQVLTPNIMPVQGSRADLGLKKAHELLKQAGVKNGQVVLIADGVVGDLAEKAAKQLHRDGYTVSVLGVGTEAGGQIPNFRAPGGLPVIAKLNTQALQAVARQGGGVYRTISNSNQDLQQILKPLNAGAAAKEKQQQSNQKNQKDDDLQSQDWKSNGPYLVLLLLPLTALAFRRGWLLNLFLLIGVSGLLLQPQPAMAFSFADLWQRPEQQADKALRQQQFEQASQLAKDPLRRGSAEYKQGHYEKALQNFSKTDSADADYNRGNALAKLKKYQEAIKAYEKALKKDPSNTDAKANKRAVEKLLKQQQQRNKQNNKNQNNKNKQDKKQQQNKQGDQKNKQSSQQNKSGDKQQQKNQQNQKEQGKQSQQDKNAEQKKQQQGEQQQKQSGDKNKESQDQSTKNKKDGKQGKQTSEKKDKQNQFSEAAKKLEEQKKKGEKNDQQKQQNDKAGKLKQSEKDKAEQNKQSKAKSEKQKTAQQKQNEADKKKQQGEKQKSGNNKKDQAQQKPPEKPSLKGSQAEAEELSTEEKMAAEQWLRRIPDDPGGLLRRKFIRQYRQRRQPAQQGVNPW